MEMSQEYKVVDTGNLKKSGKVMVDGMLWTVTLPGAGMELKVSKVQRRIKLLEKNIKNEEYDEKDLDQYDEYEDFMYNFFKGIFKDETEDNSQVNTWIDDTPLEIIIQAFEDIKEQAKDPVNEPTNG